MCFALGCTKLEDSNDGNEIISLLGDGTCNEQEYIDLDLPSGILWAICNVGATSVEDYGDYFAWGETSPKTIYSWNTYIHRNGNSEFNVWNPNYNLTKYCCYSGFGYNGFTDTLTVLQPDDDAATVNWGGGWRMPTKEEWEELYQNTTSTWTTQNGVFGRLFVSSNGKGLFLPATESRWGDEYEPGTYGYYWSSSLRTGSPQGAWNFDFSAGHFTMSDYVRSIGFTVRPVCSTRQN